MAEAVSGVVTLTTVSLDIIQKTAVFIRDAKEVDVRIQKLRSKLLDLQDWVELIDETCKTAESHSEPIPQHVAVSLRRCKATLEHVRSIVEGLASKKSGTFYQKVKLKIRTEGSKRDVLEAIEDLKHHKSHIKSCMDIWTHERTANIDRRTSEAVLATQPATIVQPVRRATTTDAPVPYRTLSNASTILEPVFDDLSSPNSSPVTTHSRYSRDSFASGVLQSLREQSENVPSVTTPIHKTTTPAEPKFELVDYIKPEHADTQPDRVDLHQEISKFKNEETRNQVIRQILERHPRSVALANTKDDCGRTPLCRAAQLGDLRLARTLMEFSADINARDSQPRSVLDHALARNHDSFVKFLVQQGVDERNVSEKYRDRFEEMKEAIEYRRQKAAKQKGKARSKNSARLLAT